VAGFAVACGVDPGVDGFDFADGSVLDEFHAGTVVFVGVNLVTHPCDDFGLCSHPCHLSGFPNIVGEGFLAMYVYTSAHGVHGDDGMHVVWSGDGNGVNLAIEFAKHIPVILKDGGFGLKVLGFVGSGEVDIAKGDVFGFIVGRHHDGVRPALSLCADGGHLEGGVEVFPSEQDGSSKCGGGGGLDDFSTIHSGSWV